jgi:hypothetical protein
LDKIISRCIILSAGTVLMVRMASLQLLELMAQSLL